METCLYLHKEEDFNTENRKSVHEDEGIIIDVADTEVDKINTEDEEKSEIEHTDEENLLEDSRRGPTTDEILEMYENIEINSKEARNKITTEEILTMYATSDQVEEETLLKKTSKKTKRKKSVSFENEVNTF